MTPEERELITGLFGRLQAADTQQRDGEADSLIQQAVARQPGAPYLLVQTLLVQEHALSNAQLRIKELERQVALAAAPKAQPPAHSGGFLSGLFGGSSGGSTAPAAANIPPQSLPAMAPPAGNVPYPSSVNLPASAGGGFLRSALTTAAGVAGGAMLFEGIESLLGHRSGAFGSGLGGGGGGFMDTGFGGRPEIIENNYYGTSEPGAAQGFGNEPSYQGAADYQNTDPNVGGDPANDDTSYDTPPIDNTDSFNDDVVDSSSGDFTTDDGTSV